MHSTCTEKHNINPSFCDEKDIVTLQRNYFPSHQQPISNNTNLSIWRTVLIVLRCGKRSKSDVLMKVRIQRANSNLELPQASKKPCSYTNHRLSPANTSELLHCNSTSTNFVKRLTTHPLLCFLQELKLKQHFLAFKIDNFDRESIKYTLRQTIANFFPFLYNTPTENSSPLTTDEFFWNKLIVFWN